MMDELLQDLSSFLLSAAGAVLEYDTLISKGPKAVEFARKHHTLHSQNQKSAGTDNAITTTAEVAEQIGNLLFGIDELMVAMKSLPFEKLLVDLNTTLESMVPTTNGEEKPDLPSSSAPAHLSPSLAGKNGVVSIIQATTEASATTISTTTTGTETSLMSPTGQAAKVDLFTQTPPSKSVPADQLGTPIALDQMFDVIVPSHLDPSPNNSQQAVQQPSSHSCSINRQSRQQLASLANSMMAPIIQLELANSCSSRASQPSPVNNLARDAGLLGMDAGKSQALFGASWCNLGTASLTDMSALQGAELKALAYRNLKRQSVQVQQHLQKDVGDDGFKVINGYTILQELGRGQYGKVKLGATEDTGEMRAIKIVPKRKLRTRLQGGGGGGGDNFLREVEVMKKLKHPNIVQLHEVIDDPNSEKLYIVMQYIERGPIVAMANNGTCTALDMSVARGYMKQIVNALVYLHHKKICHCDIKPDNILLSAKGLVFLSDFGVSGMFDDPENADDPQATKGTPLFMAPEEFQRREKSGSFVTPSISPPLSPQSDIPTDSTREDAFTHVAPYDIWALGMTFYLMCCGKLPFSAEALGSLQDVAEAVLHSEMNFDVENISSYKPAKRSPTRGTDFKVRDLMSDPDSPFLQPLESIHNNDDAMASDYVPPVSFVNPGSDSINDCVEEDEELDELMFSGTDWHQSVVDEKRREWNAPGSGNSDEELLMDLLAKMLDRNPATRYDIKQVRKHPFISDKEKRLLEKRVREEKSAKDHQTNSSSSVNSIHLCGPLTPKKKEKALSGFTDKSPLGALV